MKKMLTLLLAALILLAALTGCARTEQPARTQEPAGTADAQQPQTEEKTQEPKADVPESWLCEEKTTLTVLTFDSVGTDDPPSNDQEFWQWMEDYTNVHIEWEIVPYAGYEEVIKARLSAGQDLPDIINVYKAANAVEAGRNGILLDMAENWDTCFTKTQAHFDVEGTDYKALISDGNGEIWALCCTVEPVEGHMMIMYNTAWMEKLGAEIPTTLDEFTELLRKAKAAGDLNGNGIDDEIPLTSAAPNNLVSILGNAFGLEQYGGWDAFVADENGVVSDEYTSEGMKAYLSYVNELYNEGLLDPEITTMSASMLSEKAAADRVFAFVYYSGFAPSYGAMTPAGVDDPFGEHFTLGAPLASEWNGNEGYYVRRETLSSTPTAVTANCSNPELAMRWLDTMFADEQCLRVRTCGIEGEHYKLAEDGGIELIMPEDGSSWTGIQGGNQITLAFIQTKEQLLNTKTQYPWYLEEYERERSYKWVSPSVPHPAAFADSEQEIFDTYKTDVNTYFNEMRDKFIMGEASVEKDWDTFVSTMNTLGLPYLTEAYQSVYDRTR